MEGVFAFRISSEKKKKKNQATLMISMREANHRDMLILGREVRGKKMSLSFLIFTYSSKNKVKLISQ